MLFLLLCGIAWRGVWQWLAHNADATQHAKLAPLQPDTVRHSIAALVYYLMLPALIIEVIWRAPIGWDSLRIAASAGFGVLLSIAIALLVLRLLPNAATKPALAGAFVLACGFPNVTYLGLPILDASFGDWARSIAIKYDMLACTPLLMTVGVYLAQRFGAKAAALDADSGAKDVAMQPEHSESAIKALLKIPALSAVILALLLNALAVPPPSALLQLLSPLSDCVVPLMLLALGMSLRWQNPLRDQPGWLFAVILIQLLLYPVVVWALAAGFGLRGEVLAAVVVEAAMPCMVLGIVICDRYGLDSGFYAVAVLFSTVFSVISLPLWLWVMT